VALPAGEYRSGRERAVATFERIVEETARVPGVTAAAVASHVPMAAGGNGNGLIPEGKPIDIRSAVQARLRMITPDFFDALRVPVLRGRVFDSRDRRGAQKVMIVSETLAAALFPGQDPLGRRVACCESGPDGKSPDYKVIVGVARDMRATALAAPPPPDFYLPIQQVPDEAWDWVQRTMYVVARTDGDPGAIIPPLKKVMTGIDPDVPLFNIKTLEERMSESLATGRFNTVLLTLLGAIGLVLSAIGIYGVVAYFVTQRTPEIGVRMALGATRSDVVRLVLGQAVVPVAIGLVIGVVGSLGATRVLSSQLVGIEERDPFTLVAVIVALGAAALLAAVVPARRAAGVDPTRALLHV
jgi:predicted permease